MSTCLQFRNSLFNLQLSPFRVHNVDVGVNANRWIPPIIGSIPVCEADWLYDRGGREPRTWTAFRPRQQDGSKKHLNICKTWAYFQARTSGLAMALASPQVIIAWVHAKKNDFHLPQTPRSLLIASYINLILYTYELYLAYQYFYEHDRCKKDRLILRLAVAFNVIIDGVGTFFTCALIYQVSSFRNKLSST